MKRLQRLKLSYFSTHASWYRIDPIESWGWNEQKALGRGSDDAVPTIKIRRIDQFQGRSI